MTRLTKRSSKVASEEKIHYPIKEWQQNKLSEGYFGLTEQWLVIKLIQKEINESNEQMRLAGNFNNWVKFFGREKITKTTLELIEDYSILEEIYYFLNNKRPLPARLQRVLNYCWFITKAEGKYVDKYPQAVEVLALTQTLISDTEINEYMPLALQPLKRLHDKFIQSGCWSGGELDYATSLVQRLANPRQILSGFFLTAMDRLKLTSNILANSAPYYTDQVREFVNCYKNHGLSEGQITSLLENTKFEDKLRIALVERFKYELDKFIVNGKLPQARQLNVLKINEPIYKEKDVVPELPKETVIEASPETLDKWKSELSTLVSVTRKEVIARLKEARELGDISENSEYEEAKREQSFVEGRIKQLENNVRRAVVVNNKPKVKGVVSLGSQVTIRDLSEKESITVTIVGPADTDIDNSKISISSPVGKALSGKKEGNLVVVTTPSYKKILYKVLSVN